MRKQTADPNFLRTLVPLDGASPGPVPSTVSAPEKVTWFGPKKADASTERRPLSLHPGLSTTSWATPDHSSSQHLQMQRTIDQVLETSQETTSEVKVLQDQVATILEVVHSIAANEGRIAKEGRTAQTVATSHVGSSKWASSTQLDLGKEVLTIKQHVSTLEMALRRHLTSQASEKGQGDDVKSAITAFESRLEFRLSALQEADENILQRCHECTRSSDDIKSILDDLHEGMEGRGISRKKMQDLTISNTLFSNFNELDMDGGAGGDQHEEGEMDISTMTGASRKSHSDNLAAARGWKEEPPEDTMSDVALRVVDRAAFAFVLIDLALVGVISHVEMQNTIQHIGRQDWISLVQLFIALAFTAELTVRCCIQRWQFFKGPGIAWNLFDLFVTSISLLNAVLQLVSGEGALAHVSFLRILRLLRLVRAARMLRKLRSLYECRLIMDCMADALVPTLWGFLLLLFTIYLVAAMLVQLLEVELRGDSSPDPDILQLYGGLDRSMYTLFLAVTGGAAWHELAEPLGRRSEWLRIFFMLYVSYATFGMLNILSAVFVSLVGRFVSEHREENLKEDYLEDASTVEELRELLKAGNTREDGRITLRRVEKILSGPGASLLEKLELSLEQVTGTFKMLDAEEKGAASVDEFMYGLEQLKSNPDRIHISTLMYEHKRLMLRINWVGKVVKKGFDDLMMG